MVETKSFTSGGLNTDVEESLLSASDWVDALNIRIGSPDAQVEAVVSNIRGNQQIGTNYVYPDGTNRIIGAYSDELRRRVYCFLWNSLNQHRIFYIDITTGIATDIFKNITWTGGVNVLRFDSTKKINDIDIINRDEAEGDIMFWIDGNAPRTINVLKGQLTGQPGGYPATVIEDYISLAKAIPDIPYNVNYINVVSNSINNLRRKLFQFRYRWVYDDLEKSPWGGWSDISLPRNGLNPDTDSDPTKNCAITMLLMTGSPQVTKIEISVRQNVGNVWQDALLFEILDKAELLISDNSLYTYTFTNNNAGTVLPVAETSLLYSTVPLIANAQELVNGNTLLYGATTEGFDTPEKQNVTIIATNSVYSPLNNGDSVAAWKWGGRYKLGIVYYDEQGRTDGVHTYADNTNNDFIVNIPDYNDDGTLPPATNYQVQLASLSITIRNQPPLWASKFRIVRSQCLTYDRFSQYIGRTDYTDNEYFYISLDNINKSITSNGQNAITYDFIPGDRIKFVRRMGNAPLPGFPVYPNVDAEIIAKVLKPNIGGTDRDGVFLKIKINAAIIAAQIVGNTDYLMEFYTPATISNKILFYEFAATWDVLNPHTANRAHAGLTNQDIPTNTPCNIVYGPAYGDVYVKRYTKQTTVSSGGAVNDYLNAPVQDMNYNEAYASAVNGNGRGLTEDPTSGRRFYPNLVRFGGQYIQGTNINQTNIFYPENFDEYDRKYGEIKRLKTRDREVRVYQELKVGRVPVYQQVIKDATGSDVLAQSDKLINNIQYFSGEYGIGNAPESLASNNFADYFCDTNRGVVCRISQNGLTAISITEFNNKFYTTYLPRYNKTNDPGFLPSPLRPDIQGYAPILGVFDAQHNEYIIAMSEVARYSTDGIGITREVITPAVTRSFDEKKNRFISPVSYEPEYMTNIGIKLITFKNGLAYTHDSDTYCNFYGVQYDAYITTVFNKQPNIKKTFLSLDEYSDDTWVCDSISTSEHQTSNLVFSDFSTFEGHKYASFLGDIDSPGGILNGDSLKGGWIKIQFIRKLASSLTKLVTVAVKSITSNENLR